MTSNHLVYFSYKFHPPNVVVPQSPHMPHPWGGKPEITPPGLYLPLSSEQPSPTVANFKSGGSAFTQVEKLSKVGQLVLDLHDP